jgi:hypothetical protein
MTVQAYGQPLPSPDVRPAVPLLSALLVASLLTACGGDDRGDLASTCTAVRNAFPATIYDDHDHAVLARRLGRILEAADDDARAALAPLERALTKVVSAHGDNEAVVTANVELLAAIEEVNSRCRAATGKPVH